MLTQKFLKLVNLMLHSKMKRDRQLMFIVSFIFFVSFGKCENNEVLETKKPFSWLKSAQDILTGPTGQMAVHVAKELINRSTGNTQILSLNLSNILILIFLKILIYVAGMLGSGHLNSYARSNDLNDFVANGEPILFTGFLAAQGSGKDGCLHKAACISPKLAQEYATAARALLNGIQMFDVELQDKARYKNLIDILERGVFDGLKGAPCELIYRCNI